MSQRKTASVSSSSATAAIDTNDESVRAPDVATSSNPVVSVAETKKVTPPPSLAGGRLDDAADEERPDVAAAAVDAPSSAESEDRKPPATTTTATTTTTSNTAVGVVLEIDSEMRSLMEDLGINEEDLERSAEGMLLDADDRAIRNDDVTGGDGGGRCRCPRRGGCGGGGCYKMGNCTVVAPRLYERTGMGIVGPHWWGVLCTLIFLVAASVYFVTQARRIGVITFSVSLGFAVFCPVALFFVALRDPGFIHSSGRRECQQYLSVPTEGDISDYRFCGFCNVYQPPNARHCPECNMCVIGYDHHCPWMGTCVGKHNMKAFIVFNLSWLFWFLYAIGWITLGSSLMHKLPHHHG